MGIMPVGIGVTKVAGVVRISYPANSTLVITGTSSGKQFAKDTNTTSSAKAYIFLAPIGNASYTLTATNSAGKTVSKQVYVAKDQVQSVVLAYFSATIKVTYPAKSTCVIKNSSGTQVASDTNTGTAAKTWTATVDASGTYTITATATDGSGKTKSTTVSITTDGQAATVTLNYKLYLFNKGEVSGIDWEVVDLKQNYATASIGTTIQGSTTGAGGDTYQGWSVSSTTKINTTGYTKLCANVTSITPNGLFLGIDVSQKVEAGYSNLQAYSLITQKGEVSVDISSINTSGYIGLGRDWGRTDNSQLTVDQIWLE